MEKSRIKLVPRSQSRENKGDHNKSQAVNNTLPDVCVQAVLLSTNNHLLNTNQNVNSDIGTSSHPDIKCPLPQESTQSNKANGGGDTITSCCSIDRDSGKPNQNPAVHRKPLPLPVPWKPRKSALVGQEDPEEGREGRETIVRKDVAEENKGWVDDCVYEMECSVDKEVIHGVITCHPYSTGVPNQLELNSNCHLPLTVATSWSSKEDGVAQSKMSAVPKKPQRHSSPAALVLEKELSEEGKGERGKTSDSDDDGCVLAKGGQDGRALNVKAMRALPATPGERPGPGRSILQTLVSPVSRKNSIGETLTLSKLPRSTLGKQRAKSFSSADFTRSEGQKWNSFRRLLELKLSVKMLPELLDNGGQSVDCTAADAEAEQCVDGGGQDMCFQDHLDVSGARRFSCPQLGVIEVGVEQSVDEFHYPGAAQAPEVEYENVPYYEELPEYIRSSIDEDVGQMDDGQSNEDEDIMDNFQKLIQVQCRLNGHHELVLPGRVFLKEGVLMNLSRKVMQPRMFFLVSRK
ncbi:unnamed protein product [Coregonus sp. 'balchen']|nr:unnamed protein product [Coregonus sp. 'balchen']